MQKYEIVSKEYRSNCMVEALKAKIHNPKIKLYFCKPRITENGNFQMFHFMWSDGKADYDFSDLEENGLPPYRNLLFKGVIRKFNLGFAKKYSRYRNKRQVIKMPVHKVKGGYRFGRLGKTYRGKGAKKKAQKQARAIYASGYKGK